MREKKKKQWNGLMKRKEEKEYTKERVKPILTLYTAGGQPIDENTGNEQRG